MSSDAIKDALEAAYPGSNGKDWKRRSKKVEDGNTVRDFEHSVHGRVTTYESVTGITLVGRYKEKSGGAVAYACSIDDAFLFKLTLGDPELDVIILDMSTMEEIVENNAVSA